MRPEEALAHFPDRVIFIGGGPPVWTVYAPFIQHWDITRLPYDGEADRWFDPAWLVAGFGCAGGLVLAATVISVYKPWGRTRFGRRAVTSQARAPRSDRTVATGAR